MFLRFFTTIISFLVFAEVFSQSTLIGSWRRVDSISNQTNTNQGKNQWGDTYFYKDSTFHIHGDSSTNNSTTPGWHVGEESKGTWEVGNKNHLTLWLQPKESKFFIVYIIIKLTDTELILRSNFDKRNKKNNIKYARL